MFLAGTVMFGVLVAFAVYRIFYLGLVWVEYDIPAERGIGFVGRKYRQRKIPLNRLLRGYKDFEKTLELTGGAAPDRCKDTGRVLPLLKVDVGKV